MWHTYDNEQDGRYKDIKDHETELIGAKAAVTDLNNAWSKIQTAKMEGEEAAIDAVANFAIGLVTTALTKGGGAIAYAPSVFNGYTAAKANANVTATNTSNVSPEKYMVALDIALSAVDKALSEIDKDYKAYTSAYDTYIAHCAKHQLIRFTGPNAPTPVYSKEDMYNAVNNSGQTTGWWHTDARWYPGNPGPSTDDYTDHSIDKVYKKTHWQVSDLPKKYPCDGSKSTDNTCKDKFRTPKEAWSKHRVKCGTKYYVYDPHEIAVPTVQNIPPQGGGYGFSAVPIAIRKELDRRTVDEGCGEVWYTCDSDHTTQEADHRVRTCKIEIPQQGGGTDRCEDSFRKCMGHKKDHDESTRWNFKTVHSDDAAGDSADAGDDSSAMHACGIHATTVSGSHSQITPPCGDSAHAGYACQISSDHNTAMSGWSGPFYECQPHTNFSCGHTDPTANAAYHAYASCGISGHFVCDSLTHVEEQCSNTSNGVRCTYQFWRCLHPSVPSYGPSHTCVYGVSCGRSGCSQTVSSSTQHSATCASGHSYWTCNPSDVSLHITRTCRLSTCGKSWERCSTVGGTPLCDDPWRRSNGLPCWKK